MKIERLYFTVESPCDGLALSAIITKPENPKALVQISHGMVEHIDRYEDFMRYLAGRGYAVYAHNHLGHKGSVHNDRQLGYFAPENGYKYVLADLLHTAKMAKKENPGKNLFVLGHSMGSFLVRTYAIENSGSLSGLIVCATGGPMPFLSFIGHTVARIQKKLIGGKKTAHFINKLSLGGYSKFYGGNNWLSRDRKTIEDYENDELCGFIPTVALFENLLYGTRFVNARKNIARMRKTLPVLLIAGDGDPVGNFGKGVLKVETLFRQAGMNDVECKIYSEARHELLNETNKSEVMSDILNWIELRRETK